MLTPRMPLYIPLVYNVFLYSSTVAAWRLNLRPLPEAALTGLMGEMIYAPYDVTGKPEILREKIMFCLHCSTQPGLESAQQDMQTVYWVKRKCFYSTGTGKNVCKTYLSRTQAGLG